MASGKDAFYMPNNASNETILEGLRKHGIVVVENYLERERLTDLRREYDHFLKDIANAPIQGVKTKIEFPGTRVLHLQTKEIDPTIYPVTREVFSDRFMEEISEHYFRPLKVTLNDTIYLVYDFYDPDAGYITHWHFDQLHTLKFFIYLEDTTVENGAFQFAPGSHREGRFRANCDLLRGKEYIDNILPEDEVLNGRSIEGTAGSMIIFDTDGFHRGGKISPHCSRHIMRGHTHYARRHSDQYKKRLIGSSLNLIRYFGAVAERHLAPAFRSKAYPSKEQKKGTKVTRYEPE